MGASRVFVNGRSAVHKGSQGRSTAFPDVNLCPPSPPAGPVPTPLPNMAQAADMQGGATSVLIDGNPAGNQGSFFSRSTGNAVARTTGGGVVSHNVEGAAHFLAGSPNVMCEGKPMVRHLDMMTHNHMAKPQANTAPAAYVDMMDVGPVKATPAKKKEPKTEPQTVEVFLDAHAGSEKVEQTWELASDDGKWKQQVSTSAAAAAGGKLVVKFQRVPPGKRYGLYQVFGEVRLPVFESVPLEEIDDFGIDAWEPPQYPAYEVVPAGAKKPKLMSTDPELIKLLETDVVEHPADWYEPELDPEA